MQSTLKNNFGKLFLPVLNYTYLNRCSNRLTAILSATLLFTALTLSALPVTPAKAESAENTIRKNLTERLPQLPRIDEVSKTPMNGLYEVRLDETEIYYTDSEGNFLIQGNLIDTRSRKNLTEERTDKLLAVAFDSLPVKDAFTIVRGSGKRKIAVFEDPNCGYCKRFERDLQKIDNITVHLFLYPILSADSNEKSRNIWCAKDRSKVWQDWMVRGQTPQTLQCDSAVLQRNVEFGKKHKINGTPTILLADGTRVPGAIETKELEKLLADVK
jgi:thiol:disulfide interchange protein DsbC